MTPGHQVDVHMAAAVAGRVEAIVTWNNKDFACDFMNTQGRVREFASQVRPHLA
jgi:hypothetical protein